MSFVFELKVSIFLLRGFVTTTTAELNERFLDRLEVETICMKALKSDCTVSTFNIELLDLHAIQELEREFHMEKEKEEKTTCTEFSDDYSESKSGCKLLESFTPLEAALENIRESISPLYLMARARNNATKASAYGTRTLNRNRCLASLEALKNAKPTLNRADPRDVLAIDAYRSTLGIYSLKNSPYSIDSMNGHPKPLNGQQLYIEKCLKTLSLIQDIYYFKMVFNET